MLDTVPGHGAAAPCASPPLHRLDRDITRRGVVLWRCNLSARAASQILLKHAPLRLRRRRPAPTSRRPPCRTS
jgi:hypothetical protein